MVNLRTVPQVRVPHPEPAFGEAEERGPKGDGTCPELASERASGTEIQVRASTHRKA
jgi:hypothetical protein